MQSIFRLPWSSDQFGLGAADKVRFGQDITPIRTDMSAPKQIKRKRATTPDPESLSRPEAKKVRPSTSSNAPSHSTFVAQQPVQQHRDEILSPKELITSKSEVMAEDTVMTGAQSETDVRRAKLCQAIENQMNLQILLKHNELRLIDQELAKCQVALEQLRRCELQPYPGSAGFDYKVSTGTGPAVQPAQGHTVPTHAPPHGVVNGPYTRHYRQWLIPDGSFDSQPMQAMPAPALQANAARNGRVGRKSVQVSTYGVPQQQFAGLPQVAAPAPKKDSNMPLVLRRSTDNKLVKLVCNNCNRGNMSSIQGFLNHCRIAHKVIYESHDAAAKDCGRILDEQELANLPAETQSQPVTKPVARREPSRVQTAVMAPPSSAAVHPLNAPGAKIKISKVSTTAKPVAVLHSTQSTQHATTPFKPAISLPRLSALFARKQAGGDLEQAAADARSKSELGLEDAMSPASMTPGSPAIVTPTSGRGGLAAAGSMHRFTGGKGRPSQHSYFAPASSRAEVESPREMNLSPHAVDSNPGLVSDLEDDDNGSASEEESAPHHTIKHPLGMNRTCGSDGMDIAVTEDDAVVHHHDGVIIRRNSTFGAKKLGGNQA